MSAMCAYMPSDVVNFSSFYGGERGGGYPLAPSGQSQVTHCWPAEAPAAKRRCTDKSRMWAPVVPDISFCPTDCVMCQDRRPLQERRANGVSKARPPTQGIPAQRQLSVDPKKDYSSPLFVDCSVEYDLPRVVKPPPGAQPLLIKANDVWWGDSSRRIPAQNHSFSKSQQVQSQPLRNLERIPMPIAATAPNLIGRTGPCNCPSCLGRYWSPPVGATASSIAVSVGYPQMAQGITYVDQSSAARRRKRTIEEVVKMSRNYPPQQQQQHHQQQQQQQQQTLTSSTSSGWVPGIDLVFNNRLVTPAPWMALKFTC